MEAIREMEKTKRDKQRGPMLEIKYFVCGGFRHIACYCRNKRNIEENRRVEVGRSEYQSSSNKFEVLMGRVMQVEISNKEKEKKEKLLREVIVKIGLKQKDKDDRITVEVLLNSRVTRLVVSLEFARKNKFKKKKLNRLIYMRNVHGTFNYEGLIEYIVEIELFYKGHKKRTEINVIRD